ncbi:macrophage mannose receptor 1-like [Pygocentrus nattereri]|uniref:macrophage mannose receptor 1-like n=1 Tax=Pygocentrus nattereri TaxID=42514 RepID=UPI0018916C09|nr:macrophage mannose receptor 1-like [Pygocentrus nattereri]
MALHRSPMLDLVGGGPEPGRVTWAAKPPGARRGTLPPGLVPGVGPGDPLLGMLQACIENVLHYPTQMICAGLEEPGTDAIRAWTHSLAGQHRATFVYSHEFSSVSGPAFLRIRQFHVVNQDKNWTDAQKHCRETYTDLATIESQEEMNALIAVLNGTASDFWIGMNYNTNWAWSDGSAMSYTYWMSGEPNNIGVENCAKFSNLYAFSWNNIHCHLTLQFICYKSLPLILIKQQKTWREALRYCRENHVDLVSVHTEKIQKWVETAVYYASTANVWMGLRHTCAQSFWFWLSGSTICYQNWALGNGTGLEDCSGGEITGAVQSGSKQWVSLPEDQRLNFICTTSEEY